MTPSPLHRPMRLHRSATAVALFLLAACGPTAPADPALGREHAALAASPFALVTDLAPGPDDSAPTGLLGAEGWLYFVARLPGAKSAEVYRTDGTAAGTVQLSHAPADGAYTPSGLTPDGAGRVFFFSAPTGPASLVVADIASGATRSVWLDSGVIAGDGLVPVGGGVLVAGLEISYATLWWWDGGNNSAQVLSDTGSRVYVDGPLVRFGAGAAFLGHAPGGRPEVWLTDGQPKGTRPAALAVEGTPQGALAVVGGALLFLVTTPERGLWLLRHDGVRAEALAEVASPVPAGTRLSTSAFVPAWGGTVFSVNGTLWWTDGTAAGTRAVGRVGGEPLGTVGPWLLLRTRSATFGEELQRIDATGAVGWVKDFTPGTESTWLGASAELDGYRYLLATTASFGTELWRTDGTAEGTVLVADFAPGAAAGASGLATLDGRLFVGAAGAEGTELRVATREALAALPVPSVQCPDVAPFEATGPAGAETHYPEPIASSDATLSYSLPSGATLPLGTRWVEVRAANASGVQATCAVRLDVVDTTPPALTCPAQIRIDLPPYEDFVSFSAWSTAITVADAVSKPSLTSSRGPSFAVQPGSTYPLDVFAVDGAGNQASCHTSLVVALRSSSPLTCPSTMVLAPSGSSLGVDAIEVLRHLSLDVAWTYFVSPSGTLPLGRTVVRVTRERNGYLSSSCDIAVDVGGVTSGPGGLVGAQTPADGRGVSDRDLPGCTSAPAGLAPLLAALWLGPALLRRRRRAAGAARA